MNLKETNPKAIELLATLKDLQMILKHTDKINLGDFYRSNGIGTSNTQKTINKHLLDIKGRGLKRSVKWATIDPNLAMCEEVIKRSREINRETLNKHRQRKRKANQLTVKKTRVKAESDIKLLNHLKKLKSKLDRNEIFGLEKFHRENGYTNGYLNVAINDFVLKNKRNQHLREWKIGEPTIETVKQIKDIFNVINKQRNKDVKIPLEIKKENLNAVVIGESKKIKNTKQALTKKQPKKRVKTTNEYSIYLFGLRILTIKRN